ncbi:MAG: FeoB small GTPase domain-containing protein [Acidobacteriota bacterium]
MIEPEPSKRIRKIILVGQPNVGKSAVFTRLTGRYAAVSNYPGTTVEIFRGGTAVDHQDYEILDTPGIHSLFAGSADERATLGVLRREKPDLIIQVADGTNLRPALLLTAQLAQLGRPLLLDLNMTDERGQKGIRVDCSKLSERLGIPVVETTATTGQGMEAVRRQLNSEARCILHGCQPFEWVEDILEEVRRREEVRLGSPRSRTAVFLAASLLGVLLHFENYVGTVMGWPTLYKFLEGRLGGTGNPHLLTAVAVVGSFLLPVLLPLLWALKVDPRFRERLGIWARRPVNGLFILLVTLSLMYQFVGHLGAQSLVGVLEEGLFAKHLTPFLQGLFPPGWLGELLVGQYGVISVGLTYGIAIVLPVVATFFVALSFLEDSGYLPRLTLLSDRLLRTMGLNGKAFLPMVLGLGCVTMATLTTRILPTRRERLIATLLLALGMPCSAQLGVIMGIVAGASAGAALLVFGTVFLQLILVGAVLSRILKGRRSPFIMELPPIRFPLWGNIFRKTWVRVKWFLREALPLFVLGTLALFLLDRLHVLDALVGAAEPVVTGLLDLPRRTATVFFMGFLRRDYGAAGLFDMVLRGQLDWIQTIVGLTVMTLFVPCLANFFVMVKEQGLKVGLAMVGFITFYSVGVGAVLNWIIRSLSVTG